MTSENPEGQNGKSIGRKLADWFKEIFIPLNLFTGLLVIVAGLQTCALNDTDKTLADTLATNRLSQRAFVFPSLIQTYLSPDLNDPKAVNFIFAMANNGNAATRGLRFFVKCTPSGEELDDPWILISQGREKASKEPAVIGPKGAATTGCSFPIDQLQAMISKKLYGYILIDITYEDGMNTGVIRTTQLAVGLTQISYTAAHMQGILQVGAAVTIALENRGKHNCADEDCPKN